MEKQLGMITGNSEVGLTVMGLTAYATIVTIV